MGYTIIYQILFLTKTFFLHEYKKIEVTMTANILSQSDTDFGL